MEAALKEDVILALCGVEATVPHLPLQFEGLVGNHRRLVSLNDYGVNLRLADLYKKLVSLRGASLEEIYVVADRELQDIDAWCTRRFVFLTPETTNNDCFLNNEAQKFVKTGTAFGNQLVMCRRIKGFDMSEWNDRFFIEKPLAEEVRSLVLGCGKMCYFAKQIKRKTPHPACKCRARPRGSLEASETRNDLFDALETRDAETSAMQDGETATTTHSKDCSDTSHSYIRVGSMSVLHCSLTQEFNKMFFPLVAAEASKVHKYIFLNDCSRITDMLINFDATNGLYDYPFKLKFSNYTLKDQIFKILNMDLASTFTAVELISIDIDSLLRVFLPESVFSELELIFRYLFALTYLSYYSAKTGKRTLLAIVTQVVGSYQMCLSPAKSTSLDECLHNLSTLVKKALGMFGMLSNEILGNLEFIDCGMAHILGNRGLADVLSAAKKADIQGLLNNVNWDDIL